MNYTLLRSAVTDGLWSAGDLSYLLRKHGQRRFYDFVKERVYGTRSIKPIVANLHRRLGKSYGGVIMCLERCVSRPNQMVKYGAGTDKDVEGIAVPFLEEILQSKPEWILKEKDGEEWRFWNPSWGVSQANWSRLHLVGMNSDNSDRLRGRACDFTFLDEVRNVKKLRYAFEDVLAMQFVGRENPGVVIVSTPPKSMEHEFVQHFIPTAKDSGRYLEIRVTDNPDFSEEDSYMVIDAIRGGEGSMAWKREALCQLISDSEMLITPEMADERNEHAICVPERERPPYFYPMTVLDGAYIQDKLAILFGYVDFRSQILVIEDSFIGRELTTKEIQSTILRMEHDLGYNTLPHKPRRKGDLTAQQLGDLNRDYKLRILRVQNRDPKENTALSELRTQLSNHRIRILTERKTKKGEVIQVNQALIHQLKHGIYNEARNDYQRTESMGHWDGGQALAYFVKVAPWRENPHKSDAVYPGHFHVPHETRRYQGLSPGMRKIAAALTAPFN